MTDEQKIEHFYQLNIEQKRSYLMQYINNEIIWWVENEQAYDYREYIECLEEDYRRVRAEKNEQYLNDMVIEHGFIYENVVGIL